MPGERGGDNSCAVRDSGLWLGSTYSADPQRFVVFSLHCSQMKPHYILYFLTRN